VPIFGTRLTFSSSHERFDTSIAELVALKEHGFTSLRWRLPWHEIFPREGQPDGKVLELLAAQAGAFADCGLDTWVTLCGAKLPHWFLNDGAFSDDKATERAWPLYVDTVAEAVNSYVAGWMPFEAPISLVHDGWRVGAIAPHVSDEAKFADAFANVVRSWLHATRLLNGSPMALSLDLTHPGANREVRGVWHEAIMRGRLALPGYMERELDGLMQSASEISLNLRQPIMRGDSLDQPRWRDEAITTLQWAFEAFSSIPLSITDLPHIDPHGEHEELLNNAITMVGDLQSDGLQLAHVWCGDSQRVAGMTTLPVLPQ